MGIPRGGHSALVLGATGLTGSHLLRLLLHDLRYEKVCVLARRPAPLEHPKLEWHEIDFDRLEKHAALFKVHHVFSCFGATIRQAGSLQAFEAVDRHLTRRAAKLSKQAGVQRFLWVSSVGSNPRSLIYYSRVKGRLDEDMRAMRLLFCRSVRPSFILGPRRPVRILEQLAQWLLRPFFLLLPRRLRPIHAGSIAWTMICIANDQPGHEWLEQWPEPYPSPPDSHKQAHGGGRRAPSRKVAGKSAGKSEGEGEGAGKSQGQGQSKGE